MKEINIGREAGVPYEQARLAVHSEGKTTFLGSPGSVPRKVSRNHCKITIGACPAAGAGRRTSQTRL